MKIKHILFPIVILTASLGAIAQTESESKFLSQFPEYKRTDELVKDNLDSQTVLGSDGMRQIARYRFKSKKAVAKRTYLNFTLAIFEYETAESAAVAFKTIQENIGAMFYKSPEYITVRDNMIYWLSGACLYSAESWEAIEDKLQKSQFGDEIPEADKMIRIPCGGDPANQ